VIRRDEHHGKLYSLNYRQARMLQMLSNNGQHKALGDASVAVALG